MYPFQVCGGQAFERRIELRDTGKRRDRSEDIVLDVAHEALDATFLVAASGCCKLYL